MPMLSLGSWDVYLTTDSPIRFASELLGLYLIPAIKAIKKKKGRC
jgi:hypothetical protein